jgi:group I intron endonuclease
MTEFTDFLRMSGLIVRSPAIYRIVNLGDDKFYIGSTVNVVARARVHWKQLRDGTHHCIALRRAVEKYGLERFRMEVLEWHESADSVLQREEVLLKKHYGQPDCYNSTAAAIRLFDDPEIKRRSAAARRNSATWRAKANEQMERLQAPEMRAKCIAACLQSDAFMANSRKQGANLCRPEIKARAVAASVAARAKPVVCVSSDGSERVFASSCEAARVVNGSRAQSAINAACTHGRPSLGYRWRWANAVR